MDELNEQFAIPGQLEFRSGPGGLVFAEISNEHATASVALQGAQVVTFAPHGERPLIFVSEQAVYASGKSIRGGIPICWPWFGPHPTDPDKQRHGFARTALWSVLGTTAQPDGSTELRLGLSSSPATLALWPHDFQLELIVQVGRELSLTLETHNPNAEPLEITEALHTYFSVGSISTVQVHGLEGTEYADKVADGEVKRQEGPVTFSGETDSVYMATTAACTIEDPEMQRRIHVGKSGSNSTVVWNPWSEGAKQVADLGDEEYKVMLCVEVANALSDRVIVGPGDTHRITTTIRTKPISE